MITFTIPGQPQGKGRPRATAHGGRARMYTPAKTASYEGLIAMVAGTAMGSQALLEGAAFVSLDIRCQVPASWSKKKQAQALAGEIHPTTKPDVDNVEKAVFDGLNGVVWKDDVQVIEVAKRKRYAAVPGVVVTIRPIEHAGAVMVEMP